jgi:acetyl esterase/lipase
MMKPVLTLLAGWALAGACATTAPETAPVSGGTVERPISFSELLERARASADVRIAYGERDLEYGELWLPEGPGPHPVVAMIHGGCWQASLPGTILQDYLAEDLRAHGVAVWNIEYARIGHEDGAYPGTFEDIAAGIDHLRVLAGPYGLDLDRLVFTGHSAGGHLALWAAARGALEPGSALYREDPLLPDGVITLAGINDLEDYRAHGPGRCGEPGTVDALGGADAAMDDDVYAQISPAQLLPFGVEQIIISGEVDPIVPPVLGDRYVLLARAAGESARAVALEAAGHFELIDPTAPAWPAIRAEIDRLLAPER